MVFEEYLIPLMILTFCYGRIIWILSKRVDSNLDQGGSQGEKFQLARKNTIKTFLLVSICFALCWLNAQLLYLLLNLGFNMDLMGTYSKFSTLIAFVNCTINPFVYLIKYKDYQTALKLFFVCKCQRNENMSESQCEATSKTGVNLNDAS